MYQKSIKKPSNHEANKQTEKKTTKTNQNKPVLANEREARLSEHSLFKNLCARPVLRAFARYARSRATRVAAAAAATATATATAEAEATATVRLPNSIWVSATGSTSASTVASPVGDECRLGAYPPRA